jgi:Ca2+-binding EF-hand superfamily protein
MLATFQCFRLCKLSLTSEEASMIFNAFDTSGNGTLSFEEFLRAIRGRMSPPRKTLVVKVFNELDKRGDGNGLLTVDDIAPYYNAAEHPSVKAGDKTEQQILEELLQGFEGRSGNHDGTVSLNEWVGYYEEMCVLGGVARSRAPLASVASASPAQPLLSGLAVPRRLRASLCLCLS